MMKFAPLIFGSFMTSIASATTLMVGDQIGIDFGRVPSGLVTNDGYNALTAKPGSGQVATLSSVDKTDGSEATDVTFSLSNDTIKGSFGGDNQFSNQNYIILDGVIGAAIDTSATVTLKFTGLNDSLLYSLSGATFGGSNSADYDTVFTVDGKSSTADAGRTRARINGIESEAGEITITLSGTAEARTHITIDNLVLTATSEKVVAVPEPSSFALLGVGGLLLMARRKRA